jgi:hypothetical protein
MAGPSLALAGGVSVSTANTFTTFYGLVYQKITGFVAIMS